MRVTVTGLYSKMITPGAQILKAWNLINPLPESSDNLHTADKKVTLELYIENLLMLKPLCIYYVSDDANIFVRSVAKYCLLWLRHQTFCPSLWVLKSLQSSLSLNQCGEGPSKPNPYTCIRRVHMVDLIWARKLRAMAHKRCWLVQSYGLIMY